MFSLVNLFVRFLLSGYNKAPSLITVFEIYKPPHDFEGEIKNISKFDMPNFCSSGTKTIYFTYQLNIKKIEIKYGK